MKHLNKTLNNDRIVNEGHLYELENFENKSSTGQVIQFIEKVKNPENESELLTVSDGTTNEEVLKVLIHRCEVLYRKFPSDETFCAIGNMKQALYALQSRTYERSQRGVEGKHIK